MPESDVIIRPIDLEHDAERLSTMWDESDLQWPGSWGEGVPFEPWLIREWHEEERSLIIFVAEVNGAIAGYCSFVKTPSEKEAYLELLNVSPKYQKRSIGRRLIQATIDYSVEKGFVRQTLHTWPANFKAVPTYKKTGHFWTPDRGAWMQNYIPGALQMPLARPFFERHDWYRTYVRELEQEHDDERWRGLKVFTQHWEADGQSLTIRIDREARAPVAVETDALSVCAIVDQIEPVGGTKVGITWEVSNRSDQTLPVYLHATGDKGLSIDHRDVFVVPGGEVVARKAVIDVAEDAPRSKEDETAPAVRTILQLGDVEAELFSGLRTKAPLAMDTEPGSLSIAPRLPAEIQIQLHNERPEPCTVNLVLTPPKGLVVDWTTRQVELSAESHTAVPLTVTSEAEGVYSLPVRVTDGKAELDPIDQTVTLFCLGAGSILAHHAGKSVRVETDELRITAASEGGGIKIEHKDTHKTIVKMDPHLGPPYYPSDFEKVGFELTLDQSAGHARVCATAESKYRKGLFLIQELDATSTGLCGLRYRLENRGSESVSTRMRANVGSSGKDQERIATHLAQGLIHCQRSEYPIREFDLPRDPAAYREPWLAWDSGPVVGGVAWDSSVADVRSDWGTALISQPIEIGPGQSREAMGTMIYACAGDWRDLRAQALRWSGLWTAPEDGLIEQPMPRSHTLARIEPELIATLADQTEARLVVDTLLHRPTDGSVSIQTEQSLSASFERARIEALTCENGVDRSVQIDMPQGQPGVYSGHVRLSMALSETEQPFNIVRLGTETPVGIERSTLMGKEVWSIANGAGEIQVCPEFGPSVIAWNRDGHNQLYSTFPKPEGMAWLYPWFGGIHSRMLPVGSHLWAGVLHEERFDAEAIEATDPRGITWRGVRMSARPKKEQLRDLFVELKVLTVGGSNMLKFVQSVRNLRDTAQVVALGSIIAAGLGTTPTELTLHGEGVRHQPMPWGMQVACRHWGALSNQETGKALLVVSARPDVELVNTGYNGRHLGSGGELRLPGGQTRERVYYMVLADSLAEAKRYRLLKDY